jgi:hypothetical protein
MSCQHEHDDRLLFTLLGTFALLCFVFGLAEHTRAAKLRRALNERRVQIQDALTNLSLEERCSNECLSSLRTLTYAGDAL